MSAPGLAIFARELALGAYRAAGDVGAPTWEALPPGEREVWWAAATAMQTAVAGARARAGGKLSEAAAAEAAARAVYWSMAVALHRRIPWDRAGVAVQASWRDGVRQAFAAVVAARAAPARVAA